MGKSNSQHNFEEKIIAARNFLYIATEMWDDDIPKVESRAGLLPGESILVNMQEVKVMNGGRKPVKMYPATYTHEILGELRGYVPVDMQFA